jgi:hypothetical protein
VHIFDTRVQSDQGIDPSLRITAGPFSMPRLEIGSPFPELVLPLLVTSNEIGSFTPTTSGYRIAAAGGCASSGDRCEAALIRLNRVSRPRTRLPGVRS